MGLALGVSGGTHVLQAFPQARGERPEVLEFVSENIMHNTLIRPRVAKKFFDGRSLQSHRFQECSVMFAIEKPLFDLTAADLQSRTPVTLRCDTPLRDAARELSRARVHGAPVVDAAGRCVGVLSVSDLARWAVKLSGGSMGHVRSCGYQDTHRGIASRETIVCTLSEGKCPFQSEKLLADKRTILECREPHAVLLEWQMVESESLPLEDVRHYMTAEPVTVSPETSITELARMMVNSEVQRVIVVDSENCATGVVSSTDLLAAVAAA